MKKIYLLLFPLLFLAGLSSFAQSNMGTGTLTQCGGTYNDPGGAGNYPSNANYTQTICAVNAGDCISLMFTSFSLESGWDYLYIYNGPSTASPQVPGSPFTGTTSPGTITSTTGCLTLVFTSDAIIEQAGWTANVICNPCGAPPPPPPGPITAGDCSQAVNICTNASFQVDPNGSGNTVEFTSGTVSNPSTNPASTNSGCLLSGELNSTWMIVNIASTGTLEFSFGSAGVNSNCYDWIMWPYTAGACTNIMNNTLPPIRCNWNGWCGGFTGIAGTLPAGGDASNFEPPINATCGQQYLICLSNYSSASTSVPLSFFGTAAIACSTFVPITVTSATVCPGQPGTITASGGNTYSWSNGGNTASITVSPTVTTTYTVTGSGSCGTGTATATVTVLPANDPSCSSCLATASNAGPYCTGQTIALSATGGGTYSWSGPNGFTSTLQNPTIGGATTAMAGVYTVTVTNGAATCTATTTVTINSATATASNTGPYCPGATIQLNGTGGGTYAWTGPGFSSALQNPTIGAATTAMSGTYSLTVTNNGCTATASTNVVVNNGLIPNLTSNSPVCQNQTLTLSCTNGVSWTWSGPGGFSSTVQSPSIASATTAHSGTYTVTVTDASGCTGTGTITVVVNPLPTVTASNTGPYCIGSTIQLNGTGGTTYSWSGPGGFTSAIQNPTIASATLAHSGTYTVAVTDANGCAGTATTSVTVNSSLIPSLSSNSPVCENGTLTISCSNGASWSWSGPGSYTSTAQTITFSPALPAHSGTYSVTVADAMGCSGTGTISVVVNPLPVITVTSASICATQATATLTASGASTYSWSSGTTPSNTSVVTAAPVITTQYTVTGTDANGCASTAVSTVTVNALPNVTVTSASVCAGSTASITASGAATYTWSSGTTPSNGATVSATAASTTQYTVTGTDANGCTATAVSTVTINNNLTIDAGVSDTICPGDNFTLNATGAVATYVWNPGNMTGQSQSMTASATQTYTVSATDANGCTGTDSITITVPAPIVLNAAGFPASCNGACNGQVVVLPTPSSGPFSSYTYLWTPNGNTTASVQNACAGTYNVLVTNNAGCTATATAVVTEPPALTASASNNIPATCNGACNGQVTITAAGGTPNYNYSWSTLGTGSNPTNLCAGTYTCTVTDANSCTDTVHVTITEPAVITASIIPISPICIGQTANLTAIGTGGDGNYLYSWAGGTIPATGANVTATPVANSTYTVTITDGNNCPPGTATITVQVAPSLSVTASPDDTICVGSTTTISATASGGNGVYTYSWSPNPATPPAASVSVSPSATTTYTVTVTDGCNTPSVSDNVVVVVNPLPVASISVADPNGCAEHCTSFTATSTPAIGTVTWTFTDGQTASGTPTPSICFATAGTYGGTINVTDINGCTTTFTDNSLVDVYPVPVAEFTFDPTETTDANPVINFTDQSTGGTITDWLWDFGNALDSTSATQHPSFDYGVAGTYVVTLSVTTNQGCTDTVMHTIIIEPEFAIYIPNAFTPNDDGYNDFFFPKGIGIDTEHYQLWIYDRWGNMIWSTTEWGDTWDGKVLGHNEIVMQDVYVWKMKVQSYKGEKKSYVGHVSVIK